MEKQIMVMEDPRDTGLKAVMGSRFQDLQEQTCPPERKKVTLRSVREAALWGGALAVFGWWLHRGQMTISAAIPAMVFCALMGGYRFGKGR